MATLRERLLAEPDRFQRRRLKAEAIAQAALTGRTWTRGRWAVTVVGAPQVRQWVAGDGTTRYGVELSLRVERNGVDVTPADLNPILVPDPPLLVEDPNGPIVRTGELPDGSTVTRRYRDDIVGGLLSVLWRALSSRGVR